MNWTNKSETFSNPEPNRDGRVRGKKKRKGKKSEKMQENGGVGKKTLKDYMTLCNILPQSSVLNQTHTTRPRTLPPECCTQATPDSV